MSAAEQSAEYVALLRLAEHLASEAYSTGNGTRCDLTAYPDQPEHLEAWREDHGRCKDEVVGVRWEDGFADKVCERHAENAESRGVDVVRPRRHDGSLVPSNPPGPGAAA